jgi:AraC family transcriptional regulator
MEALIEEIVRKLHHLPEVKILEVLDFVDFLTWNKERSSSQQVESDVTSQEDQEFEAITRHVADNPFGVVEKTIPGGRCAVWRYIGDDAIVKECLTFRWSGKRNISVMRPKLSSTAQLSC